MNHLLKKCLCLCLPVVLLSGCTSPFQKEESDGSGYLFTYTLLGNPENLDPLLATDASSKLILRNMMQGLLEENPDGTLSNGVADSYIHFICEMIVIGILMRIKMNRLMTAKRGKLPHRTLSMHFSECF